MSFHTHNEIRMLVCSTLPQVSIDKNDCDTTMFSKYFLITNRSRMSQQIMQMIKAETKDSITAELARKEGNTHYRDKNYKKACYFYDKSIRRAPRDSIEFAKAIVDRSAVLFDTELYQECLQDIEIVLKSEYSSNLLYEIFLRQARCFLKLNLNFEAARSIRRAQNKIDELKIEDVSVNNQITEIKETLRKQLNTSIPNNPVDYEFPEPQLRDGENPNFLNASKVVDIGYSEKVGRLVVATTDIKQGDVLLMEEPYTFIPYNLLDLDYYTCFLCLKRTVNLVPCTDCITYIYCSDICRSNDLNHSWECPGVQRKLFTLEEHLCLSMLLKASRDEFETTLNDETIYGNEENNYPYVNKLVTNKELVPEDVLASFVKRSVWLVMYLINLTDYFDWLYTYPDRPLGTREDLHNFVGGQFIKYFLQIGCNSQNITDSICGFNNENITYIKHNPLGFGLYVSTALLNHSCVPNAYQSFHGTKSIIKASENIPTGTEITINYIDKIDDIEKDAVERQIELQNFLFVCTCRACSDPKEKVIRNPLLCPRCTSKAYENLDNKSATCSECSLSFNAANYLIQRNNIYKLLNYLAINMNYDLFDNITTVIQNTQHKHSSVFYKYNQFSMTLYNKKAEILRCMEMAKVNIEITTNLYPRLSERNVLSIMTYIYFLVKHCKVLKETDSPTFKIQLYDVKELMKESVDILEYFLSRANLKRTIVEMMELFKPISDIEFNDNVSDYNNFIRNVLQISI